MTQRRVHFVWEVVEAGEEAGELEVDASAAPILTFDGSRAIQRSLDGLRLPAGSYDQLDLGRQQVRPTIHIDDVRWPLGLYTFADPLRFRRSFGTPMIVPCLDALTDVDEEPAGTMYVPRGYIVHEAMNLLLSQVPTIAYAVDAGAGLVTQPMAWPTSSTRLQALNDLAQAYGYYPAHTDNEGVVRMRRVVDPDAEPNPAIDHDDPRGVPLWADTIAEGENLLAAHNRFQVIGGDPDRPIVGTWTVPPSAPNSAFNRGGRVRTLTVAAQGISDQASADFAAAALSFVDQYQLRTLEFATPLDGRDHSYALVRAEGESWLDETWTMELRTGGAMTHRARRRL